MKLTQAKDGVVFFVKVIPNAAKNQIVGWENDHLKIKIHAPPDKGKANDEVIDFLSEFFDISKSKITILQGKSSRIKKIFVQDASIELIERFFKA